MTSIFPKESHRNPTIPPPPPRSTPPPPRAPLPPPQSSIPSQRRGGIPVGLLVALTVVGVVTVVAAFVILLTIRRRWRRLRKGSQGSFRVNEIVVGEGNTSLSGITPCEVIKLQPSQSPKAPPFQEIVQLPNYQEHYRIHSATSGSSSLSSGENVQPPLITVGVRTFTFQELSDASNQFNHDTFLGQDGFGSVHKGQLSGGDNVAIKKLQSGSFQGEREFLTEINVIGRVHHRNLVSLSGYCISGTERLLVYEYVENNNLSFHLQGTITPVLDWPTRLSIALGAAKGIAYLHEECQPRIIHRDIKSTNILLDFNFRAKVADFGLAKLVPDDKTHVTTRIMGTFGYLAPEFGSSGRLTEKSDVFSFGIVLLELITGRQPINLVEWASPFLDQALEDGDFETQLIDPKLESSYDHEEMNGMVTCAAISVHRFPDHRPQMSQIVQVLEGNISSEKLKAQTSRPRTRRQTT